MKKTKKDKKVVEQLTNEKYDDWISAIRGILQQPESPLSLKNGVWTVAKRKEMWQEFGPMLFDDHLEKLKKIVIEVLKEPDPKFELQAEERFAANIRGKVLNHSYELRKGLAESLALLGSQPEALNKCSRNNAEAIAATSIREIFKDSDWVLWGSLDSLLPILAEADPEEFLSAVENALEKKPCPFDELFSQEGGGITGANYMTGLLWALETLAWEEQYLVRVTVVLGKLATHDPGGNWGNRPDNSLTTIFLPWFPQTLAAVKKRKVAVKTLNKEIPIIGWKLLLSLLDNQHQISMGCHKPVWRKIIPDGWEVNVTNIEYGEQIKNYSEIAVETAKGDLDKLNELISDLDHLPRQSFDELLEHLKSEKITKLSEDKRTPLWESLVKFTIKHRKFTDANWTLSPELVGEIEEVAKNLIPQKPKNLFRRLFDERAMDMYEEKGNYQEQGEKLEKCRQDAVNKIFADGGFKAIFDFAQNVEYSRNVGFSLGVVVKEDIDLHILPDLLETGNNKIVEFVSAFVSGRYSSQEWEWVDQVNTSSWTNTQIGKFLSYLPFNKKTWEYSKKLLGEFEAEYWSKANINPWEDQENLNIAIDNLIRYNRPNAALSCLYGILHDKKTLDKNRAADALHKALSSNEPAYTTDAYDIVEIIEALQKDPEMNQDDLLFIEWAYLPLLTGPGRSASPKLLEQRLASDPDFFCEAITLLYRSKNETESDKETTEQQKNRAGNIWRLLKDWSTIPGTQANGEFSPDTFNEWVDVVKTKCKESGHFEVALSTIGQVLINYPSDPDGLWIHRTLAEALNAKDAEKMRNGFSIGIFNSRGVHCVDPMGKPEKELATQYRKKAEDVENALYRQFADTLRSLAKSYENDAKRIIDEHEEINQEGEE